MMKIIRESDIRFGEFDTDRLFEIEKACRNNKIGKGIKTVELIYLTERELIFLEAKSSCPNPANREESAEKNQKYEEFFSDVSEKYIDSINLFFASVLGRHDFSAQVGKELLERTEFKDVRFIFMLVVSGADESWLSGQRAELEARLFHWRKIWKADVVVLNDTLARKKGLAVP